jgi:hypothetical protein
MKNAYYSFDLDKFKTLAESDNLKKLVQIYELNFFANNFYVYLDAKIQQLFFKKAFLIPGVSDANSIFKLFE